MPQYIVARFRQTLLSFAVRNTRGFLRYWLPLVLWMALIFGGSSDTSSFQRSSRIIGPLVHWLFPRLPPDEVKEVVVAVRKCAHVTEYAVLAWLVWRVWRKPSRDDPRPMQSRDAARALLFCALFAATDEFHQSLVPNREGSTRDVLIDSGGAAVGLLAIWLWGRWRKRW